MAPVRGGIAGGGPGGGAVALPTRCRLAGGELMMLARLSVDGCEGTRGGSCGSLTTVLAGVGATVTEAAMGVVVDEGSLVCGCTVDMVMVGFCMGIVWRMVTVPPPCRDAVAAAAVDAALAAAAAALAAAVVAAVAPVAVAAVETVFCCCFCFCCA